MIYLRKGIFNSYVIIYYIVHQRVIVVSYFK